MSKKWSINHYCIIHYHYFAEIGHLRLDCSIFFGKPFNWIAKFNHVRSLLQLFTPPLSWWITPMDIYPSISSCIKSIAWHTWYVTKLFSPWMHNSDTIWISKKCRTRIRFAYCRTSSAPVDHSMPSINTSQGWCRTRFMKPGWTNSRGGTPRDEAEI